MKEYNYDLELICFQRLPQGDNCFLEQHSHDRLNRSFHSKITRNNLHEFEMFLMTVMSGFDEIHIVNYYLIDIKED